MRIPNQKWLCAAVIVAAFALYKSSQAQVNVAKPPSLLASMVAGRVFHVAPTGDDTADGSRERPWKTIQKAADVMTSGDRVMIAAGVYRERVSAKTSGSAGRPISYIGAKGAVIEGQDSQGRALFNTNGQSHLNVNGLTLRGALLNGGIGILVTGSKHVRVERCHTVDTGNSGIHVDYSSNIVVVSNEVEKACQNGGEESVSIKRSEHVEVNYNEIHHTKHEGIDVKEGARHVRVVGNHVHHVERQGLYADAWNAPTYDVRFFNNVVHDCGFGVVLSSERGALLSDIWFCNNVIYNNRGPAMGVMAWGEEYTSKVSKKDIYFINNTVVGNGQVGTMWGGGMHFETDKVENLVVKNNILSGNIPSPMVKINGKIPPNAIISNNLLFGVGNTDQPGIRNVQGDPLFVNAAQGDFRLRKGSPAINRGANGSIPIRDKAGRLRDARPDIGALEYVR